MMSMLKLFRSGVFAERSRQGYSIVTVLFTASSVRVDRRGTCSIGSRRAAAAAPRGGNRPRCQARSLGATWRTVRAVPGRAEGARAPGEELLPSPASTCAGSTVASTGIRNGSGGKIKKL